MRTSTTKWSFRLLTAAAIATGVMVSNNASAYGPNYYPGYGGYGMPHYNAGPNNMGYNRPAPAKNNNTACTCDHHKKQDQATPPWHRNHHRMMSHHHKAWNQNNNQKENASTATSNMPQMPEQMQKQMKEQQKQMKEQMQKNMERIANQRMNFVKSRLNITKDQEDAWNKVVEAISSSSKKRMEMMTSQQNSFRQTPQERLEAQLKAMETTVAIRQQQLEAYKGLMAVLKDEQKVTASMMMRQFMRSGGGF
ncbi:Spy/CpxP family protein refolding chaperone [Magnetococcales bacterium HHB-1]